MDGKGQLLQRMISWQLVFVICLGSVNYKYVEPDGLSYMWKHEKCKVQKILKQKGTPDLEHVWLIMRR